MPQDTIPLTPKICFSNASPLVLIGGMNVIEDSETLDAVVYRVEIG